MAGVAGRVTAGLGARDVRKTEILFGFGFAKTEPSKNLTSVQTVFRNLC